MSKPDYDTTLARIAGNIAAGLVQPDDDPTRDAEIRDRACNLARRIVEALRTPSVSTSGEP